MQPILNSGFISFPAITAFALANNSLCATLYNTAFGSSPSSTTTPEFVQKNSGFPVSIWLFISLNVIQYLTLFLYLSKQTFANLSKQSTTLRLLNPPYSLAK